METPQFDRRESDAADRRSYPDPLTDRRVKTPEAALLVLVVTVDPLIVVVVVASWRAPIAPAIVNRLGAVFWKLEAANTPPFRLAIANCAPSALAV